MITAKQAKDFIHLADCLGACAPQMRIAKRLCEAGDMAVFEAFVRGQSQWVTDKVRQEYGGCYFWAEDGDNSDHISPDLNSLNELARSAGSYKSWYDDGTQYCETTIGESGGYTGEFKLYYASGQIMTEGSYNAQSELDGVLKQFNEDGQLYSEQEFKNGERSKTPLYFDCGENHTQEYALSLKAQTK